MKIYTGRGDTGDTDLRDMTRTSKASPRIEAYGTIDEVNALVGRVRPTGYEDIDAILATVQNHLHIVQADLSNPEPDEDDPVVTAEHVETLEDHIDEVDADLDELEAFILPGGGDNGARLHHARTVCRRAERRVVAFQSAQEDPNDAVRVYLNRLSDLLFVLARAANARDGIAEDHPTY